MAKKSALEKIESHEIRVLDSRWYGSRTNSFTYGYYKIKIIK